MAKTIQYQELPAISRATPLRVSSYSKRAFTLIELLIVVAIIAILAAIATPNFLEAQTRAKVARSHSDLRSLATALEAYRTDFNGYPYVGNPAFPSFMDLYVPLEKRMLPITTPVSYISSLPHDPFYSPSSSTGIAALGKTYCYAPGNLYAGANVIFSQPPYRNSIFSVAGRGPDHEFLFGGYCMAHPTAKELGSNINGAYDPTNGTVSDGDLLRLGGSPL